MEQTEERAVCGGSEGAKPCGVFFRAEDDPEGGEALEVSGSGVCVPRAVE